MKKILITGMLAMFTVTLSAQGGVVKELLSTKQIVKTNLVGYAFLAVNANYEYKTGPSTSVGLMAGYKIPSTIKLDAVGELDGETMTYAGEIEPKGFFANPYFRVYPSEALTGFYIETFLRYYDYTYLVPYDYTKDGKDIRANLDGTADGFGGGLAFGGQFQLGPKIYLDINTGFGVGNGNIHVETNDPNLDAEDYLEIKQTIEENRDDADIQIFLLSTILEDIEAGADESSAWADIKNQIFPIFRGGIAIGYGF